MRCHLRQMSSGCVVNQTNFGRGFSWGSLQCRVHLALRMLREREPFHFTYNRKSENQMIIFSYQDTQGIGK